MNHQGEAGHDQTPPGFSPHGLAAYPGKPTAPAPPLGADGLPIPVPEEGNGHEVRVGDAAQQVEG